MAESDQSRPGSGRGCSSSAAPQGVLCRTYPAAVDSVAEIRATVARFATQAGAAPSVVEAATLAVSEAATNVIVHAYAGAAQPGLIEIEAAHTDGELRVAVADTGPGLRADHEGPGLGLGLGIIEQLADHVELLQGGDHGLRVLMRFAMTAVTPSHEAD